MNDQNNQTGELGSVEIADEVIKTIAGMAATEVKGVFGLRGGFIEGIRQATTGRREFGKGVEVKRDADSAALTLDLFVIIDFNVQIESVAHAVQTAVKDKVESITGQKVQSVNIHISDIRLREELPAAAH